MFLETDRLMLKNYSIANIDEYSMLKSCNDIWKYSTSPTITDISIIRKELNELIERQSKNDIGFCALFEKSSNRYIGEAGILSINNTVNRCVVGYNLLPLFWNKGYATEITKLLIKYAFESLHLERVEALVMQSNFASCKVLEKAGLIKEGILRNFTKKDNVYYDVYYYGIIKSDYFTL